MKTIEHLLRVEAVFVCPNCGDTARIPVPHKGKSKKTYCCSRTYEAYFDGDNTVVREVKKQRKEGKHGKVKFAK